MTHQTRIDKANERLWAERFNDPPPSIERIKRILFDAEKINYLKGIAYSKLNLALISFLSSDNDTAIKYLSDASLWFRNNRQETGYVRVLLLKGNIYESFGQYDKTLELWLEAYKISYDRGDRESESEACNQLGLLYLRLHNYQRSLDFFNKGLEIRKKVNDENAVASSLNRIGMVFRELKRYDESLEYYFQSLEIRKKNKQFSAIQWTLLGIANTCEKMKKYPESLDYYEQGAKAGDKRCMLQCIMGSGRVLSRIGDPRSAEERLMESLRLAKELKSLSLVADAYSALADHYEFHKQPEKALKSFKRFLGAKESFRNRDIQNRLRNIEIAHAIEKSEQEKEIYRLRHIELRNAFDIIEEKNKDLTANINYAGRIQQALLPVTSEIPGLAGNCFILSIPKDVIGGDFYWFTLSENRFIIAAADCTGHGVPGALMSMLGISFLEEIINYRHILETNLILEELSRKVITALKQKGKRDEAKDGMDISLCLIDKDRHKLDFSGAHNNLYLIRNGKLSEYEADRLPVGYTDDNETKFTKQSIEISDGDILYMFTDGYADQFGGKEHKRYKYPAFRSLLLRIHTKPLYLQKKLLENEFNRWKGNNVQTDDVLVAGLRL